MSRPGGVPDAWDDDYETFADSKQPPPKHVVAPVRVSRAERKAKHAEANKQLWESAENPEPFHYVETGQSTVPLKTEFKPALKVLSRKPKPEPATKVISTDMSAMALRNDDEDDSEEEARKAQLVTLAERQRQAQRDREEKQRRYQEVRERLFGSPTPDGSNPASGATPSREGGANTSRGPGRRRGGGTSGRGSAQTSSNEQSPARGAPRTRQLYDPDAFERSSPSAPPRRLGTPKATAEHQPIRAPRGPDGSGRGGFGFAPRGDRKGS